MRRDIISFSAGLLLSAGLSYAAITPLGVYRAGEDDGAVNVGDPGAATSIDNTANHNDLTKSGSPTYASGITFGGVSSTLSLDFPGSGAYSRPAFAVTNNFGVDAFFNVDTLTRDVVVNNGNGGGNGAGLCILPDGNAPGVYTYQGLFGGVAILNTGVQATAGDKVYMALVKDNGFATVYLQKEGGVLQSFNFGARPTNDPTGSTFALNTGTFDGRIDDARFFTFTAGAFSVTNDLQVPEPASLTLIGAGALLAFRRRR